MEEEGRRKDEAERKCFVRSGSNLGLAPVAGLSVTHTNLTKLIAV